jgi:hypothetical protein
MQELLGSSCGSGSLTSSYQEWQNLTYFRSGYHKNQQTGGQSASVRPYCETFTTNGQTPQLHTYGRDQI